MDFNSISIVSQPKVGSEWTTADYLGALKVRLSIGRNKYQINPGLYKLGSPNKESEVFVTSNYKLSFDIVRKNLKGVNAWILVLQTYGINVWCAAGKGTFGTSELIKQITETDLQKYVSHKRLIVPQLGAPGVSGYKVKQATGFTVKFGPVRAIDLQAYLANNLVKDEAMKTVQFTFKDRLILTPVEIAGSLRYLLYAFIGIILLSGLGSNGYNITNMWNQGLIATCLLLLAYLTGALLSPILLPWLPFRHFGGKGLVLGFVTFGVVASFNYATFSINYIIGWLLISGAIASYLAMNFTGASTYTSFSGVIKEMKLFVPIQIIFSVIGLVLIVLAKVL